MDEQRERIRKELLRLRTQASMINSDHHDKYTNDEKKVLLEEIKRKQMN